MLPGCAALRCPCAAPRGPWGQFWDTDFKVQVVFRPFWPKWARDHPITIQNLRFKNRGYRIFFGGGSLKPLKTILENCACGNWEYLSKWLVSGYKQCWSVIMECDPSLKNVILPPPFWYDPLPSPPLCLRFQIEWRSSLREDTPSNIQTPPISFDLKSKIASQF